MDRIPASIQRPPRPRWFVVGMLIALVVFGSSRLDAFASSGGAGDVPSWIPVYQAVVLPSLIAIACFALGWKLLPVISDAMVTRMQYKAAEIRVWSELRDVLEQIRRERCARCIDTGQCPAWREGP